MVIRRTITLILIMLAVSAAPTRSAVIAGGAPTPQPAAGLDPRAWGAVGDGRSHQAGSVLSVTTLAGLAAWAMPDGSKPYAQVAAPPFGALYANFPASEPVAAGSATVHIGVRKTTGLVFSTSTETRSGNVLHFITAFGIPDGTPILGAPCIPADAVVGASTGTVVTLTRGIGGAPAAVSCPITAGTPVRFAIASASTPLVALPQQAIAPAVLHVAPGTIVPGAIVPTSEVRGADLPPGVTICKADFVAGLLTLCAPGPMPAVAKVPSGAHLALLLGWEIYLADTAGVERGMEILGAGGGGRVFVEYVNRSTNAIRLSRPLGAFAAGTSLTFVWPDADKIVPGRTRVSGPGIAAGTTVTSYDAASGVVGLSQATTAALTTSTAAEAASPALRGTPLTFWTPWSDAEATELQMDTLGLLGAEQAAEQAGGGTITVPAGHFWIDQPIVFPVFPLYGAHTPVVSLRGTGRYQTFLEVHADLGRDRYVLSCGDPTGTPENGLGIYGSNGSGAWCDGFVRDLQITTRGAAMPRIGTRPLLNGLPVSMGGIRQGPRRELSNLMVAGFDIGIESQIDHTRISEVISRFNWTGYRLGWGMHDLFGDNTLSHVMFAANSWAGMSIAADASWNGAITDDSYLGLNPYAVWCEDGAASRDGKPKVSQCMDGTRIIEPNWEGVGCAMIKDGNIRPDVAASGARRSLVNVVIDSLYTSGAERAFVPAGGCPWNAYIDLDGAYGLQIHNIAPNTFAPVSGATAIVRLHRTQNSAVNQGGVLLEGQGLYTILAEYGAACQEIVTGGGGNESDFYWTRGDLAVAVELPGEMAGGIAYVGDRGLTALPLGTVLESVAGANGRLVAQRAGLAPAGTTALLGTVIQPFRCNPDGKTVVLASRGNAIPVAVSGPQGLGRLLRVDRANPGMATGAATAEDGTILGQVADPTNAGAGRVFMRSLFRSGL